jgi:hypothetical protein
MNTIAFIGNSEPPSKLLDIFKKMTPNKSGEWGKLKGVGTYQEADYFGVIDYLPSDLKGKIDERRCVFLGAHPETMHAYRNMDNYICLAKADCRNTIGFLEWWIEYDYDYISNLEPPEKINTLATVVSNARSQSYHRKRIEWLDRFAKIAPNHFDLYGRIQPTSTDNFNKFYRGSCGSSDARGAAATGGINNHMVGKENIYSKTKYMIEFDATGSNYFSERVLDCMFLWAMPIYWGGSGLHKYLPENSFRYLNIDGNGEDVLDIINSDFYEKNLPALKQARELLLNKYQLWPRLHELIYGEPTWNR